MFYSGLFCGQQLLSWEFVLCNPRHIILTDISVPMIYTGNFYLCLCICIANDDHHNDPLGSQQSSLIVLFLIGNVGQNQVGHTNVPIYDFLLRSVVFNTNDQ